MFAAALVSGSGPLSTRLRRKPAQSAPMTAIIDQMYERFPDVEHDQLAEDARERVIGGNE